MRISHETIYQSLYVQARGELRRQLAANLRTGRKTRRSHGRVDGRKGIPEMIPIAKRPPAVDDRAVPGHWEGDLMIGVEGKSAIATLVERHTRYVLLAQLGYDRTTAHVIEALKHRISELPTHLAKSLTWDQGRELTAHTKLTGETGSRSTSATHTRPGSAPPTRTPTGCYASTCRASSTSPNTARSS